ncbi:hypothetical protein GRX03_03610 [Halovenus sp. WSH3]|uniref:DUF8107 domain-containing protein n=1 Tax=Halovenus carboxidivorans TaxID=2692199 RepID=A0A6B0SZ41_9EURY|nr:hypothetical protein [Halovenus carboxidivorans]MXR50695.1 hypothetical protein [Halovenus carboxidivorans]
MASDGDPRVLFVMNLALSTLFSYIVLRGLDLLRTLEFTYVRLAVLTVVIMAATQILVLSE